MSTFDFQLKRDFIVFLVLIVSLFLIILVYILFFILFYREKYYAESLRCYECGFDPNSFTRLVFSYRFFLISILFIIFDVEISLILPVPFLILRELGIFVFVIFIFVLLIGLIYEYFYGSLDWLDFYEIKN